MLVHHSMLASMHGNLCCAQSTNLAMSTCNNLVPDPWGKQYLRQYQSANSNSIRRESWAKHLFTSSYSHLGANVKNTIEHLSHPVCPISPILCLYLCVICVSLSVSFLSHSLSLSLSLSLPLSLSLSFLFSFACGSGAPSPQKVKLVSRTGLQICARLLEKSLGGRMPTKRKRVLPRQRRSGQRALHLQGRPRPSRPRRLKTSWRRIPHLINTTP